VKRFTRSIRSAVPESHTPGARLATSNAGARRPPGRHEINFGGILPTLLQAVTYTLIVE
jgi:hypothetical protein